MWTEMNYYSTIHSTFVCEYFCILSVWVVSHCYLFKYVCTVSILTVGQISFFPLSVCLSLSFALACDGWHETNTNPARNVCPVDVENTNEWIKYYFCAKMWTWKYKKCNASLLLFVISQSIRTLPFLYHYLSVSHVFVCVCVCASEYANAVSVHQIVVIWDCDDKWLASLCSSHIVLVLWQTKH